jgi:hypothetical protein
MNSLHTGQWCSLSMVVLLCINVLVAGACV